MEPYAEHTYVFDDVITGGSSRREFIVQRRQGLPLDARQGACSSASRSSTSRVCLNDGGSHAVDSSDIAFQEAARGAWREVYQKAKPADPRTDHEGRTRGSG
jgi:elongation factor G